MKIYLNSTYIGDIDINIKDIKPTDIVSHWDRTIYIPEVVQTNYYKVKDLICVETDLYLMLIGKGVKDNDNVVYHHCFRESPLTRIIIYSDI